MTDRSPPLVKAARLDPNGVFLGIDEIAADKLTDLHLPDITECDLTPGRYAWHNGTFVPVTPEPRPGAPKPIAPDATVAIAQGLAAIAQAGKLALPKTTQDWITATLQTLDAKGAR